LERNNLKGHKEFLCENHQFQMFCLSAKIVSLFEYEIKRRLDSLFKLISSLEELGRKERCPSLVKFAGDLLFFS